MFKPGFVYCPRCGKQAYHIPAQYTVEFNVSLDDETDMQVYQCHCQYCDAIWFLEQSLACELITGDQWLAIAKGSEIDAARHFRDLADERIKAGESPEKYMVASPVRAGDRR